MLFGYVFNITIVSALINVFLSFTQSQAEDFYTGLLVPLAVIVIILIFMRVPAVRAWGDRILQKITDRIIGRTASFNTVMPLDYIGSDSIALVTLGTVHVCYALGHQAYGGDGHSGDVGRKGGEKTRPGRSGNHFRDR